MINTKLMSVKQNSWLGLTGKDQHLIKISMMSLSDQLKPCGTMQLTGTQMPWYLNENGLENATPGLR
jgi:hypothetical protein